MAKPITFVHPLKPKRTDFTMHSIFTPEGLAEVGKAYRTQGAGPWYETMRDEPRKPRWFCNNPKCTYWTEGDGSDKGGVCSGSCFEF